MGEKRRWKQNMKSQSGPTQPGMVVHAFSLSIWRADAGRSPESEVSLVYIASSRTARATQEKSCLKKEKKKIIPRFLPSSEPPRFLESTCVRMEAAPLTCMLSTGVPCKWSSIKSLPQEGWQTACFSLLRGTSAALVPPLGTPGR